MARFISVPVSVGVPRQEGVRGHAGRLACGWCDSTHVADAHGCFCAADCGVGWCCAVEELRGVIPL